MNSHCFPFRQIPHSTQLFLDYLEHSPPVQPFYPRSVRFLDWAREEAVLVKYPADRRELVARILERQNKSFGASETTLANIAAFRAGAFTVVTGQQVGLFGGPAFSLYKALSAIKLASEARSRGIDCVPIFWLATEDHDLDEVDQVRLTQPDGQLSRLTSGARGGEDTPAAAVQFGSDLSSLVGCAKELLGDTEVARLLAESYRPGESFGTAFAKLFAKLFANFGVILLDASDPALDQIVAALYQSTIERSHELTAALLERDRELHAQDYHQQVKITDSSTPLFVFEQGSRVPLHMTSQGKFQAGSRTFTQSELLDLARSSPESFSPNVLLRPVVQDYLLPTLAYVGGSAEVAYFAQAGVLYKTLLGRVTPVLPRFSATLIEPKPQGLLERYRLSFADVFAGAEALREKIGAQLLDHSLQASFDSTVSAVKRSMGAVRDSLGRVDKTLVDSANNAESKMLHQIETLRSRAARAELRQSEVAGRHAELLCNALYPDKTLQEREVAGISLLAKHGLSLLDDLLGQINLDCTDHQLILL